MGKSYRVPEKLNWGSNRGDAESPRRKARQNCMQQTVLDDFTIQPSCLNLSLRLGDSASWRVFPVGTDVTTARLFKGCR